MARLGGTCTTKKFARNLHAVAQWTIFNKSRRSAITSIQFATFFPETLQRFISIRRISLRMKMVLKSKMAQFFFLAAVVCAPVHADNCFAGLNSYLSPGVCTAVSGVLNFHGELRYRIKPSAAVLWSAARFKVRTAVEVSSIMTLAAFRKQHPDSSTGHTRDPRVHKSVACTK